MSESEQMYEELLHIHNDINDSVDSEESGNSFDSLEKYSFSRNEPARRSASLHMGDRRTRKAQQRKTQKDSETVSSKQRKPARADKKKFTVAQQLYAQNQIKTIFKRLIDPMGGTNLVTKDSLLRAFTVFGVNIDAALLPDLINVARDKDNNQLQTLDYKQFSEVFLYAQYGIGKAKTKTKRN